MYLSSNIKKECVGCEACSNICPKQCIEMEMDEEGFYYPIVEENDCIHCHMCEKVCPLHNDEKANTIPEVYAVKHKDHQVHMESSSGGAFTAFAEWILRENGIVYASCFDSYNSVEMRRIDKEENLQQARKSKYVQSKMNDVHISVYEDLKAGKMVLYIGTACQCDSVLHYLEQKNVDTKYLYIVDIICHGVASPKIWSEYLQHHERCMHDTITHIDFRDKTNGWAPMRMNILFKNGKHYANYSRFDGYYRLFFGHFTLRPSCHSCNYTSIHRKTDLTIADFWGIKNIAPELYDKYGVSMVLASTDKGKFLLEKIKDTAVVNEVCCDDLSVYQPNLKRPTTPNKKRAEFWALYKKRGFEKAFKKYAKFSIIDRIIDDTKNIIVRIIRR